MKVTTAVLIVAAACYPFLIQAITIQRSDVREQYRPFFNRIKSIAEVRYQQALVEFDVILKQINQDLETAWNVTTTNINAIKNIIVDAQKQAINSSVATACLRIQDDEAANLTTVPLNKCYSNANLSNLIRSKDKFSTLSGLANNVIVQCQALSPLDTQDESYKDCLTSNAADLGIQVDLVEREYNKVSNATLEYRIRCLSEKASVVLAKISRISFEVNMCLQMLQKH